MRTFFPTFQNFEKRRGSQHVHSYHTLLLLNRLYVNKILGVFVAEIFSYGNSQEFWVIFHCMFFWTVHCSSTFRVCVVWNGILILKLLISLLFDQANIFTTIQSIIFRVLLPHLADGGKLSPAVWGAFCPNLKMAKIRSSQELPPLRLWSLNQVIEFHPSPDFMKVEKRGH